MIYFYFILFIIFLFIAFMHVADRKTKKAPICAAVLNTCLLPDFFTPFSVTPDASCSQLAIAMHGLGSPLPRFVCRMLQASARCGSFAMLTSASLFARLTAALSLVPSYADQVCTPLLEQRHEHCSLCQGSYCKHYLCCCSYCIPFYYSFCVIFVWSSFCAC
jgi:hypothetical protein